MNSASEYALEYGPSSLSTTQVAKSNLSDLEIERSGSALAMALMSSALNSGVHPLEPQPNTAPTSNASKATPATSTDGRRGRLDAGRTLPSLTLCKKTSSHVSLVDNDGSAMHQKVGVIESMSRSIVLSARLRVSTPRGSDVAPTPLRAWNDRGCKSLP